MDALREDIENLEQEAQRHEARVAASEQRVAELGQQIADLPPAPQVHRPQPRHGCPPCGRPAPGSRQQQQRARTALLNMPRVEAALQHLQR